MKKKKLLCTFTLGNGVGGHYYSISSIFNSSFFDDCDVLELGYGKSPVLKELKNYTFLEYRLKYEKKFFDKLDVFLDCNEINEVYCFDAFSYILLNNRLNSKSMIVTLIRCGGPNPRSYFPNASNLICFSDENKNFFSQKYQTKNLSYIPNRVDEIKLINEQVKHDFFIASSSIKILCIARIGSDYKAKIERAYDLTCQFNAAGLSAKLIIIGVVSEHHIFKELSLRLTVNVTWLTSVEFTKRASDYISNADVVVGTGRGAVEALLLDKLTFVPINNSNDLTIVSENNLSRLIDGNFSGRSFLCKEVVNLLSLNEAVDSTKIKIQIQNHYSTEKCASKYSVHRSKCVGEVPLKGIEKLKAFTYLYYSIIRERNMFFAKNIYPIIRKLSNYVKER